MSEFIQAPYGHFFRVRGDGYLIVELCKHKTAYRRRLRNLFVKTKEEWVEVVLHQYITSEAQVEYGLERCIASAMNVLLKWFDNKQKGTQYHGDYPPLAMKQIPADQQVPDTELHDDDWDD